MYKVYFASNYEFSMKESRSILITPSDDKWNDFGHRVRIEIYIFPDNENLPFVQTRGYLGFVDDDKKGRDVDYLMEILTGVPGKLAGERVPLRFFTMLRDIGCYRHVVSSIGVDDSKSALNSMSDIVAMNQTTPQKPLLKIVKDLSIFNNAFLRDAGSYFGWKNAGPILLGLEFEKAGGISEELKIDFQLAGRSNRHRLALKFDVQEELLPKRMAVIIGENGLGKSRTLGRIAKAALKNGEELTDGAGKRPSINRILAFAPTAEAASVFPNDRGLSNPRIWYKRFVICGSRNGRDKQTASDLIVQLARSQEFILGESRFNIFKSAVKGVGIWKNLVLPRKSGEPIPLYDLMIAGEKNLLEKFASIDERKEPVWCFKERQYALSSGELSFIRFSAIISLYIENGSIVLLDEPETHLHPQLISKFMNLLNSLLKGTGSVAVIATHSVYVVREVFEDQVIVLRSAANREITSEVPRLKTFGADVGAISYFVFGEDQPSSLADVVREQISRSASWDKVFEMYGGKVSFELLAKIRASMENN